MSTRSNSNSNRLVWLGVLLAAILFLALNVLVTTWGGTQRADLTENKLYTLSEGTKTVLSNLKEPLKFRLFVSDDLVSSAPQLAAFANRVREVLDAYTRLSDGKISLEVINPAPFSDEEDRAVGLGINRFSIGGGDTPLFFGLAATNSTDGKSTIPVFAPDREPNLEYDLTRLVAELGQPGKPGVAIIDGLGLAGNPSVGMPPQQISEQLRQFFDINTLIGNVEELPDNTRVVMVIHPQNLSDTTLYTLDQWVLGGGATMFFVDPYAETQPGVRPGMPPPNPSSSIDKLFNAWGIEFEPGNAVGDLSLALRTRRVLDGRQMEIANPQWLGLRQASFATDDPVMGELNNIFLTTAGSFDTSKDSTVTLDPLLIASANAGTLPAADAGSPENDPRRLAHELKAMDTRPILAARVEGTLKTAFPEGAPKADDKAAPDAKADKPDGTTGRAHLTESSEPLNMMVFGDADMLMDRNWIQQRQLMGQTIAQAFANNGDLVLNAVEQMAGGAVLAGLRGRAVAWRPFERVEALEQQAESQYRAKEQELVARLREAESKMRELSQQAKPGADLINDESAKAIEQFRANMLATRAELRDVQFNLRNDVQRLQSWITGLNVGVVPGLVAILALLYALRRPNRPLPRGEKPSA